MRVRFRLLINLVISLALVGGIILSATGHLGNAVNRFGLASISEANEAYLKDSFDKALQGFLALSAIKSSLAVLEGSEVGVPDDLAFRLAEFRGRSEHDWRPEVVEDPVDVAALLLGGVLCA